MVQNKRQVDAGRLIQTGRPVDGCPQNDQGGEELYWLFEAKKRYGICILNYVVTSNHIHLLVFESQKDVIARSIQLVAGRTGQEYNQRKSRKGAYWEDRYHATAVETGRHLIQCLVYIDLNMVRAGVIEHPS